MPSRRESLLTALTYLHNANQHLRSILESNDQIIAQASLRLKQGQTTVDTLRLLPSLSERRAAENAVTELYNARHNLRRATVVAALGEGMSVGELGLLVGLTPAQVQTIADDIAWSLDVEESAEPPR